MNRSFAHALVALALIGCKQDEDTTDTTDTTTTTDTTDTDGTTDTDTTPTDTDTTDTDTTDTDTTTSLMGVMRNCPADVGNICPWAGAGYNGFNGDGGDILDAWFSFPMSVEVSPYGDPVIADWNNHKLRVINGFTGAGTGTLETIMGTLFLGDGDPALLDKSAAGAPGTTVALNHPTQQEYFSSGILLSDSWHTHKLRTWDPATGLVHVVYGDKPGYLPLDSDTNGDGFFDPLEAAGGQLNQPVQIALDSDENVWIVDMRNERVRKLTYNQAGTQGCFVAGAGCTIQTMIGTGIQGYSGDNGPGQLATIDLPKSANPEPGGSIVFDEKGKRMFLADTQNNVIRVYDLKSGYIALYAGTPQTSGAADGKCTSASFNYPSDLAFDQDTGTLFVADADNHKIRAIETRAASCEVTTFAGTGTPSCPIVDLLVPSICDEQHTGGDGALATDATLYRPFGVELDNDGNVIIADTYNNRFRIVYR